MGQREQRVVLIFEVEGQRYAVDTEQVVEIVRAVPAVRLPRAPAVIAGLLNVRGEALPVLDLRVRFGFPRTPVRLHEAFVVVRGRQRSLVLRTDGVRELLRVPDSQIKSAGLAYADHVAGAAMLPEGLLLICDIDAFLDQAEQLQLDAALAEHAESAPP